MLRFVALAMLPAALLMWTQASASSASGALSAAEARGKHIYSEGESASGRRIAARLQRNEGPAPASIVPCVSCHGADGTGSDEAVVAPLNITWRTLTGVGQHHHGQRTHTPFDENSLARAITQGLDPSDNALDATMPRYAMSDEDLADLIAYLARLETEQDPGLSDGIVRIGTVLPLEGPLAGVGESMRALLEATFSDVNGHGGIHGRHLELVVAGYGETDDPAIWSGRDLVNRESLFALVSGFLPGSDTDYEALAEELRIPLVGPYTVLPPESDGNGRYGFYLLSGLAGQSRALVRALADRSRLSKPRLAVVYPLVAQFDLLAEAIGREAESLGLEPPELASYRLGEFNGEALARSLREAGSDAVVFLGRADEFAAFGQAATSLGWGPALLAPASLAERRVFDVPADFSGAVLLGYPSLPTDYTEAGQKDFERLHAEHGLSYTHSAAQIAAYTAARLLFEGLEQAGGAPSRERLLAALEELRGFETGLTPPLSYEVGRRLGSLGAHVVTVDLNAGEFRLEDTWISLDP